MRRLTILLTIGALSLAGPAFAQGGAPPPTQPPPTAQQPPPATPPAGQKPTIPQTPAKPPEPKPLVPFPPDAKIGFVNMQVLVDQSKLGIAGKEEMKKLRDKLMAPITAKQKELADLQTKMQTQQNLVAPNVFAAMQRDGERLQRELQALQENYQIEGEQKQGDLIANFSAKVQPIVEAVRNERGLWAVWVPTEAGGLYAVHPGLDLTAEVLKRLDAAYK
jgi:Skp family chaperone for outer membrane proteins